MSKKFWTLALFSMLAQITFSIGIIALTDNLKAGLLLSISLGYTIAALKIETVVGEAESES